MSYCVVLAGGLANLIRVSRKISGTHNSILFHDSFVIQTHVFSDLLMIEVYKNNINDLGPMHLYNVWKMVGMISEFNLFLKSSRCFMFWWPVFPHFIESSGRPSTKT